MIVRPATVEDVSALVQTMAVVAEEGTIGTEPPVDREARSGWFREAIEEGEQTVIWVLEDAGRVVGHTAVHRRNPGVLSFGMAILPEGRGRGGGQMLLEQIEVHARAAAAHKVELEVWPDNARAIGLYARNGYEVEGLRRHHYRRKDGSLRSSLIMARLFSDA
jgi:RimJ/RimL family protein N-acetyltransferase